MFPIHVTSEAMDLSAKFKEWTMQGVQKPVRAKKASINDSTTLTTTVYKLTTQIINKLKLQ